MRVAVIGSKSFSRLDLVRQFINQLPWTDVVIVGRARGVATAAELAARKRRMVIELIVPDWRRYGRKAAVVRNCEVVENADWIVAFWDGKSREVLRSIELADKLSKPLYLVIEVTDGTATVS